MKSIFIIFFILIIIIGCSVPGRPGGLIVVVTILPLAEMAERIAGERAEIVVLVPPGASPHAYEPRPPGSTGSSPITRISS
jgi:zinc transport system substrate-binding protein